MLQSGIQRLKYHFPGAEIGVLTLDPELLNDLVPNVTALPAGGRIFFCGEGTTIPGIGRIYSRAGGIEHSIRMMAPNLARLLTRFSIRARNYPNSLDYEILLDFFYKSDVVLSTGGGFVTDSFADHAKQTLRLLELAKRSGKISAMFGQGVGPITDNTLSRLSQRVLPLLDLIALRENCTGPKILKKYKVSKHKMFISGDDAIEIAYKSRSPKKGNCLGINLRAADYSNMGSCALEEVRIGVNNIINYLKCRLLLIPISFHDKDSDVDTFNQTFKILRPSQFSTSKPIEVIQQAGRCRVVITGSYHGSIFALSQGIPVVALVGSSYYESKFKGVVNQFGCGCTLVNMQKGSSKQIEEAVLKLWGQSEALREKLLLSAKKQIESGREAYSRFAEIVFTHLQ